MSVLTEQADLEAVLGMIQEQPFVDSENIFLMGTSMGGAVSAITAAAHQEEIRGAILLYPAFVMEDSMKERFESAEEIPDTFYHLWMTAGRVFAEDLLDYDIYGTASGYGRDVLLLHGDADAVVPVSYSERLAEELENVEYHVIPGAGHGFQGEDFDTAVSYIKSFLNLALKNE